MEIQSLEKMLVRVNGIVHNQMKEIEEVLPRLYCQCQDGEMMLIRHQIMSTLPQQRAQALEIGVQLRALDVVTYVVVNQGRMKEFDESRSQTPQSESSDEYEAVMIQAHNVETCLTFLLRIDLAEGKPKLVPLHLLDAEKLQGGTWDNLLMDPGAVH